MNFKKMIIFVGIFTMIATIGTFADDSTSWQSSKIVIDGNDTDHENFFFYNEETKLTYNVSNDSTDIYLSFKIADQKTIMKMARAGMTIEFKTYVKPTRKATFSFPIRGKQNDENDEMRQAIKKAREGGDKKEMMQAMLNSCVTAEAEDFATSNGLIHISEHKSFDFAIGFNKWDELIYELKVPLKELFGDDYKLEEVVKEKLKLEVVINALQMPDMAGGRSGSMGGGPGSGRGMGGKPSDGSASSENDFMMMFADQDFNQTIYLKTK